MFQQKNTNTVCQMLHTKAWHCMQRANETHTHTNAQPQRWLAKYLNCLNDWMTNGWTHNEFYANFFQFNTGMVLVVYCMDGVAYGANERFSIDKKDGKKTVVEPFLQVLYSENNLTNYDIQRRGNCLCHGFRAIWRTKALATKVNRLLFSMVNRPLIEH